MFETTNQQEVVQSIKGTLPNGFDVLKIWSGIPSLVRSDFFRTVPLYKRWPNGSGYIYIYVYIYIPIYPQKHW